MDLLLAVTLPIQSDYLDFHSHTFSDRKTPIVFVYSKNSGEKLAEIRWFGRWRQFAFFPEPGTIWNPDCLASVTEVILHLKEQK